jgi:hypothetical protein
MAISAFLQDVHANKMAEVFDRYYDLAKLWPVGDPSFPLLQYIDPFGSAIFSGAQMPQVVLELEVLSVSAATEEQKKVIAQIIELAARCRREPQTFLRFTGD